MNFRTQFLGILTITIILYATFYGFTSLRISSTTRGDDGELVKLRKIVKNQHKILEIIENRVGDPTSSKIQLTNDSGHLDEILKEFLNIIENSQENILQKIKKIPKFDSSVEKKEEKLAEKAQGRGKEEAERQEETNEAKSKNTVWKCYRRPDMTDICYYRNICWDGGSLVFLNDRVTKKEMIESPDIGEGLEFEPKYWEPQTFPAPKGIYVPFSNEFNGRAPYWLNPNALESKEIVNYPGKAVWIAPFVGPQNNIWIWAKNFFGLVDAQVRAFSLFSVCVCVGLILWTTRKLTKL